MKIPRSGPAPVIPPPPPREQTRRRRGDFRWLVWPGAFTLGATLGILAYHLIAPIQGGFDYWLALLLR